MKDTEKLVSQAANPSLSVKEVVDVLAAKLGDAEEVLRARVFPYQLLAAYKNCAKSVPQKLRGALEQALEAATRNVPEIPGKTAVCIDVSGSMSSPVTGYRCGSTTSVRCVDAAALMASCILRRNPDAVIVPFDGGVREIDLSAEDSVMCNAAKLAALCGGWTSCSAAMAYILKKEILPDTVIYVSDNESWLDTSCSETETLRLWNELRALKPNAKLVNIDIQPYRTTQTCERADIVNVGGFSDEIFSFISSFVSGKSEDHWVDLIEGTEIGGIA